MKRLPKGILKRLYSVSKIKPGTLSDYATTTKRPGAQRAKRLEEAAKEIGLDVPATIWLYGTANEIKCALTGCGNA